MIWSSSSNCLEFLLITVLSSSTLNKYYEFQNKSNLISQQIYGKMNQQILRKENLSFQEKET